MPAPTVTLPLYGAAPNQIARVSDLEAGINAGFLLLWDAKAQQENSGRIYASRLGAENDRVAGNLPATLGRVVTLEGGYAVFRGALAEGPDPLAETSPWWGVLMRVPSEALINGLVEAGAYREQQRVGDNPRLYSTSLAGVQPPATSVTSDGIVATIHGSGVIARRALLAVEPGRVYALRAAIRRLVNSLDPANDAVRIAVAWYDRLGVSISPDHTVVQDITDLTVAAGRRIVSKTMSKAGAGGEIVIPAGAIYLRPYVEAFGAGAQTGVEVIDWQDVTDRQIWSPDVSDVQDRLGALESLDLGERLAGLEEDSAVPATARYPDRPTAVSASVRASAEVMDIPGVGAFVRTAGAHAIESADGALWAPRDTARLTQFASEAEAMEYMADVGGEIVVPRGVHQIGPLVLPKQGASGRRVILRGEGHGSVLETSATGNFIYAGDPTAQGGGLGWEIRDLKLRKAGAVAGVGLFLERANIARIRNVGFEGFEDAIRMSETYSAFITECHATGLSRDFLRLMTRSFHLVLRENAVFNIGGYLVNFAGSVPSINVKIDSNDIEICAGAIKSAGFIHGLSYTGNYIEQAFGPVFDFAQTVTGEICGGNSFQLSPLNTVANFAGNFHGNHVVEAGFAWGAGSYPTVGNNVRGTNGVVSPSPKRREVLGAAYMDQSSYDPIGFYKDATGRVYLTGNATRDLDQAAPTFPYTIFTLPAGYRPSATMTFATQGTTTGTAKIRIAVTGAVIVESATTPDIGMGGINFMAAV